MLDKEAHNKISKHKSKSNQVYYTQSEDSIQGSDSTKKPCCSSKSKNANTWQNLLNLKLATRNMHIRALGYLDIEHVDSMDLKNISKCTMNSQQNLIQLSKFIYNADHKNELGRGDELRNDEIQKSTVNYIVHSNSSDKVDSCNEYTSVKVNMVSYNYSNIDESNSNQVEDSNKLNHGDTGKQKANKPKLRISERKYRNTPKQVYKQRVKLKEHKSKRESEKNKVEYIYFDESDEEYEDGDKMESKEIDKMDNSHRPTYKMEKTLAVDKSKLKTLFYFNNSMCPIMKHRTA